MNARTPVNDLPSHKEQSSKQQNRKLVAKTKPGSPGINTGWANDYEVISEENQLYFRFMNAANNSQTLTEPVVPTFRNSFTDIWVGIPESDRRFLLAYWHGPREPRLPSAPPLVPQPRPLILLVAHEYWTPAPLVCNNLGHELNFSASWVLEPPHCLRKEIAHALAKVLMLATRRRWQLTLKLIEEPLERWERQQRDSVTDAARVKKLDELEATYLRETEKEIDQTLRRWGFKE